MADFNFITARLATGARLENPSDVDAIVAAGITHVIDCRLEFDDLPLFASRPSITYLYNGTADDGQPKPVEWFKRSLDFALPALAQPKVKVYAHCAAGVNRGPSTAFAIMRALGFSHVATAAQIRFARPITIAGIRYADDADKAIKALGYE